MPIGAYGGFPKRLGGGPREIEVIQLDLLGGFGSAFDKTRGGYLWALCYADARAIWAGWCANKRLLNQASPARATWSLPMWEQELGESPYGLSQPQRRDQLVAHIERFGNPTSYQDIVAALRAQLGDTFVSITLTTPANALVHVPDGSYPWGTVDPAIPWSSSVSYVAVKLQDVPGVTLGEFFERVGKMAAILQPRLPVWATFGWYKVEGFVLDQANLDVAAFTS